MNAPLPGRPCPFYTTIVHVATKDMIAGERIQNGQEKSGTYPQTEDLRLRTMKRMNAVKSTGLIIKLPNLSKGGLKEVK